MQCPYCGKQMQTGYLGCSRGAPSWHGDGDKVNGLDRFLGVGALKASKQFFWNNRTPANYCHTCCKMIIDTKIT